MGKKFYLLICVVFVLALARGAVAQEDWPPGTLRAYWSDLDPCDHMWDSPDNWWTLQWVDPNWVKAGANSVPGPNTWAYVGQGDNWHDYPAELNDLIVNHGYTMTDPTIDSTEEVMYLLCGGGGGAEDYISTDPCLDHYLTITTGTTLTIGEPNDLESYGEDTGWGFFVGYRDRQGILAIGTAWPGSGTVTMTGGTVNVGVHVEVGAWGGKALLDMTDGEINITQGIYCPTFWWNSEGSGQINLHGGTINARYLVMTEDGAGGEPPATGRIDVTGGKLLLERDDAAKVQGYADGSVANMSITAYGVGHGEIITDSNHAEVGKRAALFIDYDVTNEAKTTISASATDPCQAWNPSPPDGAASVKGPPSDLQRPILSWSAGDDANTHDVYFGTSFADVNDATTTVTLGVFIGNQNLSDVNYTVGTDLAILTQYFWRIDEVNVATVVKGDVWDFTMANLGKASYPSPDVAETGVSTDVTLSWTPGIYTVSQSHDVYLGTSFDDVNEATTSVDPNNVYMGPQGPNTFDVCDYDPNALEFSTTYYWRIDETNGTSTYRGSVWSFTTSDHLTVEDFDSYVSTTEMYAVWNDGWVNESDGYVSVIKGDAYPTLTRDGNSVEFEYYNTTSKKDKGVDIYRGSWMDANIGNLVAIGPDWTISDARALVVHFRGQAGNNVEKMWLELGDTSSSLGYVLYDGDANDLATEEWHEWNIDLGDANFSGVSLTNVDGIKVGVGGTARTGQSADGTQSYVYFDDIEVWPQRCVPKYASIADFDDDCIVDGYDLEIVTNDWLMADYNVLGYTGTLTDFNNPDSAWQTGEVNNALYFEGNVDSNGNQDCNTHWTAAPHVAAPPLGLTSDTVSMTAWIKLDGPQCGWGTGLIFMRPPATGMNLFLDAGGNAELAYHWDGDHWDFVSGLDVPESTWTFVGMVVTSDGCTLYMDSNSVTELAGGPVSFGPVSFDSPLWLGRDSESGQPRNFRGWIDDARVYDISLDANEITWLRTSGVSGTQPASDPYAWYELDESSGTSASDSAGSAVNYFPVPSQANICGDAVEAQYDRYVNLRDFECLARDWFVDMPWPRP